MSGAVRITRLDLSAADLRRLAKKEKNPLIVRRMLAIALVLEGSDRTSAAQACGMDRQTLRDWVHHYNAEGVAGLRERRTSGHKSPLGLAEKQALTALVEAGPDPAVHRSCAGAGWTCRRNSRRGSASRCMNARSASILQVSATAACQCVRNIPMPIRKPKRLLKKLPRNARPSTPGGSHRQAHRNLVPGRSPDRPARHPDADLGQARNQAARATRPAI